MNNKLLVLIILSLPLLLTSCRFLTGDNGVFRDRRSDYLLSPVEPQIRVPANLDSYTLDQLYVVPERVLDTREGYDGTVPRPKPLENNRPEGVVIRRYSGENWIVIAATPGQVWPRVRDFWIQTAVVLTYENPVEGVMETTWLDSPAGDGSKNKFRVKIEPGLHAGSSDIIVLQTSRAAGEALDNLVVWPARSDSEDQEFPVLEQLSQYLADRTDIYSSSSSSLLAGGLAGERKANLVEIGADESVLELRVSLSRAWGQLGQALDRAELVIKERDRDAAVFEVDFGGLAVNEEEPGFFTRLFTSEEENTVVQLPFRITLEEIESGIRVRAQATEENVAGNQLETELLQLILDNLG